MHPSKAVKDSLERTRTKRSHFAATKSDKPADRAEIAQLTDEYLASGGRIQIAADKGARA